MKLVWTKSTKPLSLLIRAITGQDCSHFAFVFNNRAKGVMFESNLLGTHIKFYESSKPHFEIVHELNLDVPVPIEDAIWDVVVEKYDGKRYDIGGALYLGVRILMRRFLKIPLPKQNIWADPNAYFCDEVFEALHFIDSLPKIPVSNGLETPHDVWEKLKGTVV